MGLNEAIYNYKLVIAYDGTAYGGWQIQPNAVSIQAMIQEAIQTIIRCEVNVIGSGRTDAGVHALGQVAHFKCSVKIDLFRFLGSINSLLPRDIRILHIEEAPIKFHAQHSAVSKTYYYHISLGPVQNPLHRLYRYHVREKVDIELMKQAASLLIGTHDFSSFANEAHKGSAAHDAVRTLKKLDVVSEEGGIRLELSADGFLYKMVRNIVGTLLDVGHGKTDVDEIVQTLAAKDRRQAGQAAPPHGLFLIKVEY